jgi:predicted transcriptional regulator
VFHLCTKKEKKKKQVKCYILTESVAQVVKHLPREAGGSKFKS